MSRNVLYLVLGAILLSGCVSIHEKKTTRTAASPVACTHSHSAKPDKVLRHVVIFRFKDAATAEQIQEVEKAFAALPSKIPAIYDFEWGTDVSVEDLADGFTHCFVVTFLSEEDRAKYLPHPEHEKFVELIGPVLDKPFVIDYWAECD